MFKFTEGDRVTVNNFFTGREAIIGDKGVVIRRLRNKGPQYPVYVDLGYRSLAFKDKELDLLPEKEEELWV
jgi:hypothetical protein